jgi:hypothetical protein
MINMNASRIGAVRVAKVTRYYTGRSPGLVANIPLCDCVDSFGGAWFGCRIITQGGGVANDEDGLQSFEHWPPPVDFRYSDSDKAIEDSGEVLLAFGEGGQRPPAYVIGTVYTPGLGDQFHVVEGEELGVDTAADYGDKVMYQDRAVVHRGIRVVMAGTGTYLVDTKLTKQPIRLELAPESWVRVSQDDSDEFVLLGTASLNHIRQMHTRIDALTDCLKAYQDAVATAMTAISVYISAAGTAHASPTDPTGAMATAATTCATAITALDTIRATPAVDGTLAPNEYPFDFSHTGSIDHATDGGSDKLKAACFRISSLDIDAQPEPEEGV